MIRAEHRRARLITVFCWAVPALLLAGCASAPTHVPVPWDLRTKAVPPGCPIARYATAGEDRVKLEAIVAAAITSAPSDAHEVSLLAISCGGERGAFTAGVLNGWSERGDRPEFQVVCGVSVGALIAPLAFVGPEMDGRLRDAVAHARSRDTFRLRSVFAMLRSDSLAESEPLARSLEKVIDADVIAAVARGHAKGRRLLVVTTDLDAQRALVWDLGALAASGHPDAPGMFRRVLLASAAVPAAYPPQYIPVEANGRRFDEMHVDGGVVAQVMLPLPRGPMAGTHRPTDVYVIMNWKLATQSTKTQPRILSIAARSLELLQRNQARADAAVIRRNAQSAGSEFWLTCIPADFDMSTGERSGLDPKFVKALYECGRELTLKGDAFRHTIPGLELSETDSELSDRASSEKTPAPAARDPAIVSAQTETQQSL